MQIKKLKQADTVATFLETGDLKELNSCGMMINQLEGNPLDGSMNQLYLRIITGDTINYRPMIGSNSKSDFYLSDNQLTWQGEFEAVRYQVDFRLGPSNQWFWRVNVTGTGLVDIVYGQDIGLATKGAVQSNEAYVSQYLDHHIWQEGEELVVLSRQNQPQNEKFPALIQGSFQKLVGYSTDGYQFFGRSFKQTNTPEALGKRYLANEVYQYEFAYTALQTEAIQLTNESKEFVFYGAVTETHPQALAEPFLSKEDLQAIYETVTFDSLEETQDFPPKLLGEPITGNPLTEEELAALYPIQTQIEKVAGQTYSFFTENYHHVVLQEKEIAMERAHGHILLSGKGLTVDEPLLSTTVYMYGIFNSQVVLGNTTMNKLMSNSRNALNVMKRSGQRIYILENGLWRLLTMPSAFEMGLNSATWYYKLPKDTIRVRTFTSPDSRVIQLEVTSQKDAYMWAVSNHLLLGPEEVPTYQLEQTGKTLRVTGNHSATENYYPELTYALTVDKSFQVTDSTLFGGAEADLLVLAIEKTQKFSLLITGSIEDQSLVNSPLDFEKAESQYLAFINGLLHHFELTHTDSSVQQMNQLTRWYTHNMLVHYLSPHGLEQYGGAAWGTRDVSQGPTEFFFATQQPKIVASIIQHLFENQFEDDGNWPQWFMFDRYEEQKASESHGDIIVWPLKVVTDYLEQTADYSILATEIPYTSRKDNHKTKETASLFEHLKKEINYIEQHFLPETFLSCYGDGDWDDTLQPYDNRLKEQMASSWTVALTYQVLKKFAALITEIDATYSQHLTILVAGIKNDFQKYMLADETIPGFIYMETPETFEQMIHPNDQKTGIQYRLLPMTRSMLAELLTLEQVSHHLEIIEKELTFPDGVRLMNKPANYRGGVSTNFKRAEQAANFGREIGLQYVHAHIRYTEAMAKIGQRDKTWQALMQINPVQLKEVVHNAELRQANAYFSSSDGDFKTRYESQENFGKLKDGSIGVKGGWRIYSSGPGIYLNQLITAVLGIRQKAQSVVFDPMLPEKLSGLTLTYQLFDKPVTYKFYPNQSAKIVIDGQEVPFKFEENPYREGGMEVQKDEVLSLLNEASVIEIYH